MREGGWYIGGFGCGGLQTRRRLRLLDPSSMTRITAPSLHGSFAAPVAHRLNSATAELGVRGAGSGAALRFRSGVCLLRVGGHMAVRDGLPIPSRSVRKSYKLLHRTAGGCQGGP